MINSTQPVALTFTPDSNFLVTANAKSHDISLFKLVNGLLDYSGSKPLPTGSSVPASVISFLDSNGNTVVVAANSGSDDISLFLVQGNSLSDGQSRQLPQGNAQPGSIALSPDASQFATANSGSSTIALLQTTNGIIHNSTSYVLPGDSMDCVSIVFSPQLAEDGSSLVATANFYSDDVSIAQVFGLSNAGQENSGDGGSTNIAIIAGPIVGGVAGLTGLVVAGIAGYFAYKYFVNRHRTGGSVNYATAPVPAEL